MSEEEERYYFRKMNYLLFTAAEKQHAWLSGKNGRFSEVRQIEDARAQAVDIRSMILERNLRLVVSITKRMSNESDKFFELVSDGNMSLIRAVNQFDYSRGFRFSTYATNAVVMNFRRSFPIEHVRKKQWKTGMEAPFESMHDTGTSEIQCETMQKKQRGAVEKLLSALEDNRYKEILERRFGIGMPEPETLKVVGNHLGLTKERIRQLQERALEKLREIAENLCPDAVDSLSD